MELKARCKERFEPVVQAIRQLQKEKEGLDEPLIVAIDGRCGSGKTTLGEYLEQVFDCNLFRMDDFFLRMEQRTPHVLSEKNGKMIPEKVGLKAVMRDGIDYEFTIVLDINMKHQAIASKDRTSLFMGKPDFTITATTGQIILDWCNNGVNLDMIKQKINQAKTIEELTSIYHQYPEWYQQLTSDFMQKKMQLQEESNKPIINYNPNFIHYGSNAVNASTQN